MLSRLFTYLPTWANPISSTSNAASNAASKAVSNAKTAVLSLSTLLYNTSTSEHNRNNVKQISISQSQINDLQQASMHAVIAMDEAAQMTDSTEMKRMKRIMDDLNSDIESISSNKKKADVTPLSVRARVLYQSLTSADKELNSIPTTGGRRRRTYRKRNRRRTHRKHRR